MRTIILASTSPFRRDLLSRLQFPFDCAAPNIDETRLDGESAHNMVKRLAIQKAQVVAEQHPNALIIGSDQCAVLHEQVLGKPHTHENAVRQLQASSGQTVEFLTSLCLLDSKTGNYQVAIEPFTVVFRELSNAVIEAYLQREQPYNCAGSFKSEALGVSLFIKMQGNDPNALIGLPMIQLVSMLAQQGITLPLHPNPSN